MKNILTPPENTELTENATSIYWFDKDGILCSLYKKVPPVSMEENQRIIDEFRELTAGQKFCLLMDITYSGTSDKAGREFAAKEFPKIVKAMAMLSGLPVSRMMANLFLKLNPPPYPAKMFANEHDAKQWLKQYL